MEERQGVRGWAPAEVRLFTNPPSGVTGVAMCRTFGAHGMKKMEKVWAEFPGADAPGS